jgi:hypothetical protein
MDVAIVLLFFARYSDELRLRWPFVFSGLIPRPAGSPIKISDASKWRQVLWDLPLGGWVVRRVPGHCCLVRVNQASYLIFDRW